MIEPEVPLKRKDQVALDEDLARNLQAQLEAELIEEERLARKQEKEANIALIESWDNTQAMIEADFKLAQRLQTEEQGEITIEERSRLFIELMNKRKKHFAVLRAEEKRRKPPTKAQKMNLMSTYLKNMGEYKHNQLKSKSYEEIQKLFDNEMRRVNTFIPMDSEVVETKKGTEESSKDKEDELESDKSKKAESSKEKAKGSRKKILGKKRAGKEQQQESSKRLISMDKLSGKTMSPPQRKSGGVFYRGYFRALFQPHRRRISCPFMTSETNWTLVFAVFELIAYFKDLAQTSSLLNANCKKALNLLKKGLLIQGEAKTTSKRRVSRRTTDC
ncbi:hypothetical protein Tco_0489714 [Tanacetum coccineum]